MSTVSNDDGGDLAAELAELRVAMANQCEVARTEQERLTFELGHRVKNTLSMVQALANQTFRGTVSVTDALGTFGERIAALARANDAILKESWTTATLGGVASSVLEPDGEALGPCTIDGPTVRIGAGAALSFALALHELATNAKRFGAWSDAEGCVTLAWALSPQDGALLDLSWTETGGPQAEVPTSRKFGLRFAESSLRSAFGPDVLFDFRRSGFACLVRASRAAIAK